MDSLNNPFNPHPHPHPHPSPPPRPHPHPTPVPPPPSPRPHPRLIMIILIALGFLLVLSAVWLCIRWIIKRRKHKKPICERKDVNVDEHLKVQKTIAPGRHFGPKKVFVQVDDDVGVHKDVHKDQVDRVGKGLRGEPQVGAADSGKANT